MAEKSTDVQSNSNASSSPAPPDHNKGDKVGLFTDSVRTLCLLDNQLHVDAFLRRRRGKLIRIPAGNRISIDELLNSDLFISPRYVTIQYSLGETAHVVVSTAAFLRATDDGFNLEIKVEGAKKGHASFFSEKNCLRAWDALLNYTLTSDRIDVYNNGTIAVQLPFGMNLIGQIDVYCKQSSGSGSIGIIISPEICDEELE